MSKTEEKEIETRPGQVVVLDTVTNKKVAVSQKSYDISLRKNINPSTKKPRYLLIENGKKKAAQLSETGGGSGNPGGK